MEVYSNTLKYQNIDKNQIKIYRLININSLSTKTGRRQKFRLQIFKIKKLSPSCIIVRIQRLKGKQVDLYEVAHDEPPHQDLHCLQIQLFASLVVKELSYI